MKEKCPKDIERLANWLHREAERQGLDYLNFLFVAKSAGGDGLPSIRASDAAQPDEAVHYWKDDGMGNFLSFSER